MKATRLRVCLHRVANATLVVSSVALIITAAVWFYFLPHPTVRHIRNSMERGDAGALSRDIDFPTLRSNLKDQLNYIMTSQATKEMKDNPFAVLGATLITKGGRRKTPGYGESCLLNSNLADEKVLCESNRGVEAKVGLMIEYQLTPAISKSSTGSQKFIDHPSRARYNCARFDFPAVWRAIKITQLLDV